MAEMDNLIQKGFERTWNVYKDDLALFILAGLLVAVGSMFTLGILGAPLAVGFIRLIEKRLAGEEAAVGDVFSLGLPSFVPALLAGLLLAIAMGIGFALLFLPGLVVAVFSIFTFHFIAYDDAGFIEAIKGSVNLVKDNLLLGFLVLLIVAVINSLGSMLAGVGGILTMPFALIFMTVVFERLRSGSGETAVAAA